MSTHNLIFEQKYEKYQNFLSEFSFFGCKVFSIFEYLLMYFVRPIFSVS